MSHDERVRKDVRATEQAFARALEIYAVNGSPIDAPLLLAALVVRHVAHVLHVPRETVLSVVEGLAEEMKDRRGGEGSGGPESAA